MQEHNRNTRARTIHFARVIRVTDSFIRVTDSNGQPITVHAPHDSSVRMNIPWDGGGVLQNPVQAP